MEIHKYLPSDEYTKKFNDADLGTKVYQWCNICHEYRPCKHNVALGEKDEKI